MAESSMLELWNCRRLTVLPLAEIEFRISANAKWPILTYDGKWSHNSNDDLATPVRCPANVEADLARHIEQTALAAYRVTGCRDYARVDLRMDSSGRVFVLEVNANPDIGPDAGFARMLRARGIRYEEFANQLDRECVSPPIGWTECTSFKCFKFKPGRK